MNISSKFSVWHCLFYSYLNLHTRLSVHICSSVFQLNFNIMLLAFVRVSNFLAAVTTIAWVEQKFSHKATITPSKSNSELPFSFWLHLPYPLIVVFKGWFCGHQWHEFQMLAQSFHGEFTRQCL